MNILYMVLPCYNEEEVLQETAKVLKEKLNTLIKNKLISKDSKIMFVDDGSKDKTWHIIKDLTNKDSIYAGVKLSHNQGHQFALLAGLLKAKEKADIVISMDADLQDDINVIDDMINKYLDGNDIVYGVRSSRKKDTFFKRFTAEFFYKFMSFLGVDIIYNHADCRLMSKRALDALEEYKEVNLFLRGIVPLLGFKSTIAYYERNKRFAGESKYPLKKMLSFALEGITSFSIKPLNLILGIGIIFFLISIIMFIYLLINLIIGNIINSNLLLIIFLCFFSSIQLISLGIIALYLGKIYKEVKQRPRYIIEEVID